MSRSSTRRAHRRAPARWRAFARVGVLMVVAAGICGFAALHKTVVLQVDGDVRTVSVFGRTVDDVLGAQGVEVGAHDIVLPSVTSPVVDDSHIVVRHARPVQVEVDGEKRTVWTTARTVGDVVAELGLRETRTSQSRSAALGRDLLRVSTTKTVHVAVDGRTEDVRTTGSTVREVLAAADVVLGDHDIVSVPLGASAVDGLVIMVTRVQMVIASETTVLPHGTVTEDDATLDKGTQTVVKAGRDGTQVVTFESYRVGATEVGRTVIASSQLSTPVDEVVKVGTRTAPPVAPVEPGTSRAIGRDMVLARGWSENEFACLDALWNKESGWRVNAQNPSSGAYGIPQALPGSKMASAGADWQTNPRTQITWGLNYIAGRYGTPCGAWSFSQSHNWY